jgi:hypothetical protein
MYNKLIGFFISFCFVSLVNAQTKDSVFLMNGHIVAEKVIDTLLGAVTVVNPEKSTEKLHYEYDDIYSVKFANGNIKYYYTQDSLRGNYFTREEMYYYMLGERDARKGFRAPGSLIGAGVMGLASGGLGLFFAPIFPYGYMALTGVPKVRIRHSTISNPNYIEQDAYILGYERVSRTRRRLQALIGGTVGLAAGYGLYFGVLKDKLPETFKLRF